MPGTKLKIMYEPNLYNKFFCSLPQKNSFGVVATLYSQENVLSPGWPEEKTYIVGLHQKQENGRQPYKI